MDKDIVSLRNPSHNDLCNICGEENEQLKDYKIRFFSQEGFRTRYDVFCMCPSCAKFISKRILELSEEVNI